MDDGKPRMSMLDIVCCSVDNCFEQPTHSIYDAYHGCQTGLFCFPHGREELVILQREWLEREAVKAARDDQDGST